MFWLKISSFFIPLLAYVGIVYGALLPLETEFKFIVAALGFLLGGLTATSIHEVSGWFARPGVAYGSASFATADELSIAGLYGEEGLLLGRHNGRQLRYDKPGHMLTLAPTRAGKGTCAVIPNLLDYPGSVVAVDIKGENYAIAGRRRRDFGRVVTLAPFQDDSHCFNPLDFIRGGDDAWEDAAMLADMLIVPSGSARSVFFENEARALLTGLILHVATEAPASQRTLTTLRRLIMLGGESFEVLLRQMRRASHPIVRQVAASFMLKDPKLQSSILAEAQTHTLVWDSARVERITSRSEFTLEELKSGTLSVFIIVPPDALGVYRPLVRLILGMAVRAMTRPIGKPKHPVLFMVDEFPALGQMKPLQEGLAYLAGYDCRLWLFAQDLGQLESVYGEAATRSIVANTNLQAFNNTDDATLEMLSRMLGSGTVRTRQKSKTRHSLLLPDYDQFSLSAGETSRPLLMPDEIRCLGEDRQLLFLRGLRPMLADKEPYYRAWRYRGRWDRWNA